MYCYATDSLTKPAHYIETFNRLNERQIFLRILKYVNTETVVGIPNVSINNSIPPIPTFSVLKFLIYPVKGLV